MDPQPLGNLRQGDFFHIFLLQKLFDLGNVVAVPADRPFLHRFHIQVQDLHHASAQLHGGGGLFNAGKQIMLGKLVLSRHRNHRVVLCHGAVKDGREQTARFLQIRFIAAQTGKQLGEETGKTDEIAGTHRGNQLLHQVFIGKRLLHGGKQIGDIVKKQAQPLHTKRKSCRQIGTGIRPITAAESNPLPAQRPSELPRGIRRAGRGQQDRPAAAVGSLQKLRALKRFLHNSPHLHKGGTPPRLIRNALMKQIRHTHNRGAAGQTRLSLGGTGCQQIHRMLFPVQFLRSAGGNRVPRRTFSHTAETIPQDRAELLLGDGLEKIIHRPKLH